MPTMIHMLVNPMANSHPHLISLVAAFESADHFVFLDLCSPLDFRGSMISWLSSYLISLFFLVSLLSSTNSKVGNAWGSIHHHHYSLFLLKSNIYSLFTLVSLIGLMPFSTIHIFAGKTKFISIT